MRGAPGVCEPQRCPGQVCLESVSPCFAVLPLPTRGARLSCWGLPPPHPELAQQGFCVNQGEWPQGAPWGGRRAPHPCWRPLQSAAFSRVQSGGPEGAACSAVVREVQPWAAHFSRLVSRDTVQPGGLDRHRAGAPGKVGGICAQWACAWPFQALEKKGISHLEEKELKERNKRIQEDNRLELQKVDALGLCLWGLGPFPREGPKVKGGLMGLHRKSRGTGWLQAQLDPGLWAVPPASCLPPPLRSADLWALVSDTSFAGTRTTVAAAGSCVSRRGTLSLS